MGMCQSTRKVSSAQLNDHATLDGCHHHGVDSKFLFPMFDVQVRKDWCLYQVCRNRELQRYFPFKTWDLEMLNVAVVQVELYFSTGQNHLCRDHGAFVIKGLNINNIQT